MNHKMQYGNSKIHGVEEKEGPNNQNHVNHKSKQKYSCCLPRNRQQFESSEIAKQKINTKRFEKIAKFVRTK